MTIDLVALRRIIEERRRLYKSRTGASVAVVNQPASQSPATPASAGPTVIDAPNVNTTRELMALDDDIFIVKAFQVTLARKPDPAELSQRRQHMFEGTSQRGLLARLKLSAEGMRRRNGVRGLWPLIAYGALEQVPIVRGVFGYVTGTFSIAATRRKNDGRWAFARHHLAQQGSAIHNLNLERYAVGATLADVRSKTGSIGASVHALEGRMQQLEAAIQASQALTATTEQNASVAEGHRQRLETALVELRSRLTAVERLPAAMEQLAGGVQADRRQMTERSDAMNESVRALRQQAMAVDQRSDIAFARLEYVHQQQRAASQLFEEIVAKGEESAARATGIERIAVEGRADLRVANGFLARVGVEIEEVRSQIVSHDKRLSATLPELSLALATMTREVMALQAAVRTIETGRDEDIDILKNNVAHLSQQLEIGERASEKNRVNLAQDLALRLGLVEDLSRRSDQLRSLVDQTRQDIAATDHRVNDALPGLSLSLAAITQQILSLQTALITDETQRSVEINRLKVAVATLSQKLEGAQRDLGQHGEQLTDIQALKAPVPPLLEIKAPALRLSGSQTRRGIAVNGSMSGALARNSSSGASLTGQDAVDAPLYLDVLALPPNDHRFLDLGGGRPDLLKALREQHGIAGLGVGASASTSKAAREHGIEMSKDEPISFLKDTPERFCGIAMTGLIEHLPAGTLKGLIAEAFAHLLPGAPLLIEGLNPECPAAMLPYFMDEAHVRFVPWQYAGLAGEMAGFEIDRLLYTSPSTGPQLGLNSVLGWQGGAYLKYGLILRKPEVLT